MNVARDLKRPTTLEDVSEVDARQTSSVAPQIDPVEFARMLWRRKWAMLATMVVIMLLAALVVKSLTPRYTATAFVEINPRQAKIVDFEAVLSGLPADTASMETELQIIRSRKLAEKTVAKLGLERDPEFNPSLRPAGLVQRWRNQLLGVEEEPVLAEAQLLPDDILEPTLLPGADLGEGAIAAADGSGSADAASAPADMSQAAVEPAAAADAEVEPEGGAVGGSVPEPQSFLESVEAWIMRQVNPPERPRSAADQARAEHSKVIDNFLSRLSVVPEGRSRVIGIQLQSESPYTAAAAANALADFYIVAQLEAKFEAAKRANSWLSEQILELREEVTVAERAVEAFRRESGLLQGGGTATLAAEQVSQLNQQYILEQARLAEAEARLRQVERLLETPGGIETLGEVLSSALIRDLRAQEATVERRVAELATEFGDRHPTMVNARAELRDLRNKLQAEVDKIVQGLRNEVAVARARAATLKSSLDDLKAEIGGLNTSEVQLRALEREAAASRALLEQLLTRSKETTSQEDFQQADATIVSEAAIPNAPSFPKTRILFVLAFVFAGIAAVTTALVVERLDVGFRSMDQIGRMLGIAPLGLIPALRGMRAVGKSPQDYILEHPTSAYGEAIRSVHTNLLLSDLSKRPRVVLFASALPGEGKTSTVASLARLQAKVGQRVIVVDCDVRRPTVHTALGLPAGPGLVELLTGEATLEDVVRKDRKSGADVITAGATPPNPPDLFDSIPMQKMLTTLARKYDLVLLDSAPIMAVSDTLFLSRLADKTVLIVRWVQTRRDTARQALARLLEARGDVAGVLLSNVDAKGHAKYSFSDSGAYHGKLTRYYSN